MDLIRGKEDMRRQGRGQIQGESIGVRGAAQYKNWGKIRQYVEIGGRIEEKRSGR